MIYQLLNKRTNILPLATSQIAHLCHQFMFALPISKPRFKSIILNQNSPKMRVFLQKNAKVSSAGDKSPQTPVPPAAGCFAPNPQPPAAGGFPPQPYRPPAAGGFPPHPHGLRRPPKQPPHCEFLPTRLIWIWLTKSMHLNLIFAKSMNLNLKVLIKHSMNLISSNQNLHCESSDL